MRTLHSRKNRAALKSATTVFILGSSAIRALWYQKKYERDLRPIAISLEHLIRQTTEEYS